MCNYVTKVPVVDEDGHACDSWLGKLNGACPAGCGCDPRWGDPAEEEEEEEEKGPRAGGPLARTPPGNEIARDGAKQGEGAGPGQTRTARRHTKLLACQDPG